MGSNPHGKTWPIGGSLVAKKKWKERPMTMRDFEELVMKFFVIFPRGAKIHPAYTEKIKQITTSLRRVLYI